MNMILVLCPDRKLKWFKDHSCTTRQIKEIEKMVIARWNVSYAPEESSDDLDEASTPADSVSLNLSYLLVLSIYSDSFMTRDVHVMLHPSTTRVLKTLFWCISRNLCCQNKQSMKLEVICNYGIMQHPPGHVLREWALTTALLQVRLISPIISKLVINSCLF